MESFAVLSDHKVKIKENVKREKYIDFARELKSYGSWRWRLYPS